MNKILLMGGLATILAIAGIVFFVQSSDNSTTSSTPVKEEIISVDSSNTTNQADNNGKILAGENSPYLEFTKSAYDQAKASGKIVFLDFYANWCPICRAEAPDLLAGFNSLTTDQVIGFRVNYNDPDTDDDEKALAKEFNIPYQHTKVILKNGKEISRSGDQWDKEKFISEINKVIK